MNPCGFLFNHVPNNASIITSSFNKTGNAFLLFTKNISEDVFCNLLKLVSKSGEPVFLSPVIYTDTLYFFTDKSLAIARPSPPLFPLPQKILKEVFLLKF